MKHEEGFTLVEVLVTVVLMIAVAFITFGFVDNVTSVSARASRNVITESDAQVVLREMTQEIRAANPILAQYPTSGSCPTSGGMTYPTASTPATGYLNCLRFAVVYSKTSANFCVNPLVGGRVPLPYSIITYGLNGGVLFKDRTNYTTSCTTPASSGTGRRILTGLANPSTQPLFTYYDGSGTKIPDNATVVSAGSVKITLIVPYQKNAPNLVLTSVASLRNN